MNVFIVLLLLLCAQTAHAEGFMDHVTLRRTISGSHTTIYGGPFEVATRQINRWLINEWDDWTDRALENDDITFFQWERRRIWLRDRLGDLRRGGYWWLREWWWDNLEPDKGGAPKHPVVTNVGRTYRLLDTRFFFVTNAGDFKWKALKATIDLGANDIFHLGDKKDWSGLGWKVAFRPRARLSSSRVIFRLDVGLEHWVRKRHILDILISSRFDSRDNDFQVELLMNFVRW